MSGTCIMGAMRKDRKKIKKNMEITPLFSKPLAMTTLVLSDEEYNKIDEVLKHNKVEIRSNNLNVLGDSRLKFLKDDIIKVCNDYWLNTLRYSTQLQLTTSWFTSLDKGQRTDWHKHANSILSGIFYFGDHFSPLTYRNFDKGHSYDIEPIEHNIYNSDNWHMKPFKGLLTFFPSEVYHKVQETDLKRTSMAFNFIPTGTYGPGDSIVSINEY